MCISDETFRASQLWAVQQGGECVERLDGRDREKMQGCQVSQIVWETPKFGQYVSLSLQIRV